MLNKIVKIIEELQDDGIIGDYAIGGGYATVYYIEPFYTYDVDIFCYLPTKGGLISFEEVYERFKQYGCKTEREYIIVEDTPVQFVSIYNELIEDAVSNAIEVFYKDVKVRIFTPEYLVAIMLQTFRHKDIQRMIKVLDEVEIDYILLRKILKKHGLFDKYSKWRELFYG